MSEAAATPPPLDIRRALGEVNHRLCLMTDAIGLLDKVIAAEPDHMAGNTAWGLVFLVRSIVRESDELRELIDELGAEYGPKRQQ